MESGEFAHFFESTLTQLQKDRITYRTAPTTKQPQRFLQFLGTGGNPVNLVSQLRKTGGFYIQWDQTGLYVDPGPGAIYHAQQLSLPVLDLDAVFISHAHTDHFLGAGAIIEAMTRLMGEKRGKVLLPKDLAGGGGMSDYHLGVSPSRAYPGGPAEVIFHQAGQVLSIGDSMRLKPIPVHHAGENYGFVLELPEGKIGYTSDTAYIRSYKNQKGQIMPCIPGTTMHDFASVQEVYDDLTVAFADVDVLIANVSFFAHFPARQLTVLGLMHLLQNSHIKTAYMTHFDPSLGAFYTLLEDLARVVSRDTGVATYAAFDDLSIPLAF